MWLSIRNSKNQEFLNVVPMGSFKMPRIVTEAMDPFSLVA
jgi:hypothetical protein